MFTASRFLLLAAAAVVPSTAATAQVVGEATTSVQVAGGVEIAQNRATRPLVSHVGVIFALSARRNGTLAVGMPGFIAPRGGAGGLLFLANAEQSLTGTNLAHETLSVSVDHAADARLGQLRRGDVTVVLAQYN